MAWPIVFSGEQAGPESHRWARKLFPVVLFLLALTPRLVAINRYITPDELLWVYRSIQLREAVIDGRWSDTLVAGHPGVTTTWLGATGISAQLALEPAGRDDYAWLVRMAGLLPDNVAAFVKLSGFLTSGRIAVALVNTLLIVAVYLLVKRLWGFGVAALAAVLLALDPFAAGLSGLLHVDALSASFATLALLLLSVAATVDETSEIRRGMLVPLALSGVAAGLAILTKTPTLVLGLVAALVFALWFASLGSSVFSPQRQRLLAGVLVWGGSLALTAFVLLPALWAAPTNVLATLSGNANRHLDEALRPTFFMGQIAFTHGVLFYPLVLLWRTSPVVVAAIVPLVLLFAGWKRTVKLRITGRDSVLPVLILVLWVVLFVGLITVAAKKFDRYALPIIPPLIILAALVWIVWSLRREQLRRVVPWVLVAIQAVYLLLFVGYPLSAYNPLVGGPYTAVRILPVGWGEGISAAGRWLTTAQPLAAEERAMAGIVPSLAPFFAGQTLVEDIQPASAADYIIQTLSGRQGAEDSSAARVAGLDLLETVRFGGLDQAWVYRNPAPITLPQPAPLPSPVSFGDVIALTSFSAGYADDVARLSAEWERLIPLTPEERFVIRIAIRDDQGNVWAAEETDLLNSVYFYPPDWETAESGIVHYALELTPAIPPGIYTIDITAVDGQSGAQLAARTAGGQFEGVVYPVGTIAVPRPDTVVSAARVEIPNELDQLWLDGSLQLLGTSILPDRALAGGRLALDLFWHTATGQLPSGLSLHWSLEPVDGGPSQPIVTTSLGRLEPSEWRPGETVAEKSRLAVPANTPAGIYELTYVLQDATGAAIEPPTVLGRLQIDNIDRVYELPPDLLLRPQTCFASTLCLQAIAPEIVSTQPGEAAEFTLYWQTEAIPEAVYTVFIHVVDEAGNIVAQADHWPGGLPTDILHVDQVVTDQVLVTVPGDLPAGSYGLRLGVYSADNGRRLPVTSTIMPAGEDYLLVSDYFTVDAP